MRNIYIYIDIELKKMRVQCVAGSRTGDEHDPTRTQDTYKQRYTWSQNENPGPGIAESQFSHHLASY